MVKIVWTEDAKLSLKRIADFIKRDDKKSALKLAETIYGKSKILQDFPKMGRDGRVSGTRELVVLENYIMVYRLKKNEIQILSIFHSARKWPAQFN